MKNSKRTEERLFEAQPIVSAPDRHWFAPDDHGLYCLACGLPRQNARHASKAA